MRIGNEPLKIKMTKTTQASPNGYSVESFYEGQEYTVSPQLARALAGAYEIVVEDDKKKDDKKKGATPPSNKATAPGENK